jgi:hypothetical protein
MLPDVSVIVNLIFEPEGRTWREGFWEHNAKDNIWI